jgi:hypothetical protein
MMKAFLGGENAFKIRNEKLEMRKTGKIQFTAKLKDAGGGGVYIEPPVDMVKTFGKKGRINVRATFDGEPYRGSLFPYGGIHRLGVLKAIREKIGKGPGDSVRVTLAEDTEERTVEVPRILPRS